MTLYLLFLLMATATVFSPGPGVVMTLSNALRDGLRGSFGGILGIKLWRAPAFRFAEKPALGAANAGRRFVEGLSLQLTNPKAIFFFLSVLPQFIDPARSYPLQFATLVLTYAALVVLIHSGYAGCAQRARRWLTSERGGRLLNRVAGATFLVFAAALAVAKG